MHKVTYLNDEEMQDVVGGSGTLTQLSFNVGRSLGGVGVFGSAVASESMIGFGSFANGGGFRASYNGFTPYYAVGQGAYGAYTTAQFAGGFSGSRFGLNLSTTNVFSGGSKIAADFTGYGLHES